MNRRRYLALGGAFTTSFLAGCGGTDTGNGNGGDPATDEPGGNSNENTGAPTDEATDEPTDEPTEEPTESAPEAGELSAVSQNTAWLQQPSSFSGSGQTVTDTFEASRFTTFVFEHDGSSNFQVELINNDSGDTEEYLVNKIGEVSGAVGVGLESGEYFLDINADGNWSIELGEPFAPEGEWGVPPASISGSQPDVFGEVEIDGRVVISGEHDGDSNFQVIAWDESNTGPTFDAMFFNEIGEFEGETSEQLSGLFYIVVKADGAYQIEIE